ncbi:protein-methionine-sulfoxide reductase catalytic subunit MsrP [Falsigemmobacter intermedius]|uniref:protein-methionine-sulfoxide reductase catalytic subunit MsrP n=1 Tax=Falsigemmobacter intermedius TaxID=1553448 RepID=UPI003F048B19
MPRRSPSDLRWSDVTPKSLFLSRRHFLGAAGALALAPVAARAAEPAGDLTPREAITTYNNFYEFGFDKSDPSKYAGGMTIDPWSVEIGGLVEKPGRYDLADVLKDQPVAEHIYRLRCVEGWSMVIPWLGFPLAGLLNRVGPQSGAKFVAFETLARPEEMPGVRRGLLDFPYVEGLRLDEAMNPLTLLATGLYGEALEKQNGAPLRLVVPWKYGFKSIKSVVKITLTSGQPPTTWQRLQPQEYGFYANVNPRVDHPRWSQASERRIGEGIFAPRRDTLMFNGYAEEVAGLYAGMDLAVNY